MRAVLISGLSQVGEARRACLDALLQSLTELRERQQELERIRHELEDTNRGVVALYAELKRVGKLNGP